MANDSDSTGRSVGDYILFAIGFVAFLIAVAGVILSLPWVTVLGAALLVVTMLFFQAKPTPGNEDG